MADSVVELLKACNAWVDPNLLALTKEKKESSPSDKTSKKSGSKRKRKNDNNSTVEEKAGKDEDAESDNDQFSFLGQNALKLKRASHVSDAEDSDDDESS